MGIAERCNNQKEDAMKPCRDGSIIVGDEQQDRKPLPRKTLRFVASEMRKAKIDPVFRKIAMDFLMRK